MSPQERRLENRVQVNLQARCASDAAALDGWVSNLSRTGVFLRSQYLDVQGADVHLSFDLPGDRSPVSVRGRIVRVSEQPLCPGMAIRFTAVSDGARHRLANFMARRARGRAASQAEL
jgi:uncharacterized protein (TIGR02266 family)